MKSPRKEHVREWNQSELRRYLESRGFKVVHQALLPAFRVGFSPRLLRERLRLFRRLATAMSARRQNGGGA